MACTTCKCSDNKCGCKDAPLTTAPVFTCPPDTVCPDPTPCYEVIQDTCVKHSLNYSIVDFGFLFADGTTYPELPAGATLEQAYQAMSARVIDAACLPAIAVHPSYVGTTALVISWENTGADTYTLSYGTTSALGTNVTGLTTTSYTLTNLVTETDYYFKVTTVCGSDSSQGAIIKVTTL
jgi:hypothetical protein